MKLVTYNDWSNEFLSIIESLSVPTVDIFPDEAYFHYHYALSTEGEITEKFGKRNFDPPTYIIGTEGEQAVFFLATANLYSSYEGEVLRVLCLEDVISRCRPLAISQEIREQALNELGLELYHSRNDIVIQKPFNEFLVENRRVRRIWNKLQKMDYRLEDSSPFDNVNLLDSWYRYCNSKLDKERPEDSALPRYYSNGHLINLTYCLFRNGVLSCKTLLLNDVPKATIYYTILEDIGDENEPEGNDELFWVITNRQEDQEIQIGTATLLALWNLHPEMHLNLGWEFTGTQFKNEVMAGTKVPVFGSVRPRT